MGLISILFTSLHKYDNSATPFWTMNNLLYKRIEWLLGRHYCYHTKIVLLYPLIFDWKFKFAALYLIFFLKRGWRIIISPPSFHYKKVSTFSWQLQVVCRVSCVCFYQMVWLSLPLCFVDADVISPRLHIHNTQRERREEGRKRREGSNVNEMKRFPANKRQGRGERTWARRCRGWFDGGGPVKTLPTTEIIFKKKTTTTTTTSQIVTSALLV